MSFKILCTLGNDFSAEAKEVLGTIGEVDLKLVSQEDLSIELKEYDAVVIGLGLNFNRKILESATKLKYIATATTGLDHIDLDYAHQKNIKIVSLKGENDFLKTITGTAELAFSLILNLVRKIPWSFDSVKNKEWNRDTFKGISLYGKTIGIIGYGRLGKMMASYARAFGMRVIFYDPFVNDGLGIAEKVGFTDLLKDSDIISIHIHLTPDTENMFDRDTFKIMKKGSFLINTSRGKIVNETELLEALKTKEIGGYGTDVLGNELSFKEKVIATDPLVEYAKENDNLLITPHIGGMTVDSRISTDIFIASKLRNCLKSNRGLKCPKI
ncbi:MAG: hydroxyacid dehydrogenase [Parcubacteria group bacterium CG11_big_fil_rev_8_21_14_0_20_39_22]|nr:MAG: hydroxyacid dehydrogenase [Parcubacteria group bacterium CG11_big_fil_rev_8_21_14_0_20_39_22]